MKISAIDTGHIESMLAQLKKAAAKPETTGVESATSTNNVASSGNVDFADALKATLEQVNNNMQKADAIGQKFAMGDDSVSLSDTMIAMQKASLSFQASVQVRNKLVSAYHDIMNMQV